MDRNKKQEVKNPRENANILSVLTFTWMFKIFRLGNKRNLDVTNLYSPLKEHTSKELGENLEKMWREEERRFTKNGKSKPNLFRALARCFWKQFLFIGCFQIFTELVVRLSQTIFLASVLNFYNSGNVFKSNEGLYWSAGFVLCLLTQCVIANLSFYGLNHLGLKIKVACGSLVYRKILKMSKNAIDEASTAGQIVNTLSNDINNLDQSLIFLQYFWIGPIQAIIIVYIMFIEVKMAAIYGILVLVLGLILLISVGLYVPKITLKAALKTDARVRLMNEIISGVKVIKIYAWEKPFSYLVEQARKNEIQAIRNSMFIDAVQMIYVFYITRVCLFVTIVSSALMGNILSPQSVFAITAFYNTIRSTVIVFLQFGIQNSGKAISTIIRIEEFLISTENQQLDFPFPSEEILNPESHIELKNVSAKWSPACKRDTLNNINFRAINGSITAVIGQVGSGKSSLFHAILRELPLSSGSLKVSGKIAYVSQEAWIFASSIRQNILFGRPMDKNRYQTVINVCQLDQDLAMFPDKDQTLIGEKGITLSGGQRARINLARAVYSEADIYLLDDPLSAVDTRVGRLIFQQCISEYLQGTTRILITHQFQYLKNVARIFVLNNGSIEASGTFQELQNSDLDLMRVLQASHELDDEENNQLGSSEPSLNRSSEEMIQEHETEEEAEHRSFGKISGKFYFSYLKAVGSWWFVVMMFIISILNQMVASGGDYFVAIWVNSEGKQNRSVILDGKIEDGDERFDRYWYIKVYGILSLLTIIMAYVQVFVFYEMCIRASRRLHSFMFSRIIRATMSFFHSNPSGRILNRFSRDMGTVDRFLPRSMFEVMNSSIILISVLIICTSVNLWFMIPITIVGSLFYLIKKVYLKTSRDVKRLEGITSSPVFNHVIATLQGLTTIRTFSAEEILTKEFDNHQDLHSSALFLSISCTYCFSYYLEFLTGIFTGIVIFTFLLFDLGQNTASIGLVVSQCILLSNMLQWGIIELATLENQMTSVERIIEYTKVEEENCLESGPGNRIPAGWPPEGRIEFRNVSLRYNLEKEAVLRNLNFVILPKEKVGIVGRTGAGKTSLITALFRLAYLEGEIYIDGLPSSKLGLRDLRSKLSIIPQEPLLFAGSLRMNLDPFDEFDDEDLWNALAEVELKDAIVKMEAGLEAKVSDGGSNFSVGQRQLLCLARAIIRKSKILVLDEATANVDPRTDDLIQKTIRRRFKDCTVLIIAHRLNTVVDCDKIIVMDAGSIVEMDHPYKLLEKEEGLFYEMVQQTGPEMAKLLTEMSKNCCPIL